VLGPTWAACAPLVGLTPTLLGAYGLFFLLGFALFALIYAAMGSFVSRPDDLQTLSLPLSLVAMAGYLSAIVALSGGGGRWTTLASFVPPFSPFVMLARVMTGTVAPWELALSVALLLVAIAVVAVVAVRLYAAGVLLYGQRPGVRAFIAAARRAG
jgi:ABC-2 type transport system permease protein